MKILLSKIIISLITLFYCSSIIKSDNIAEIYCIEAPTSKTIYFGPRLGNDSIQIPFLVRSLVPEQTINLRGEEPCYSIRISYPPGNYQINFHSSLNIMANWISLNETQQEDTVDVTFIARFNQPLGRKESLMALGFVSPDNPNTLLYTDTFILIGKHTDKLLDGYDDFMRFDSVFINQTKPVVLPFRIRNTDTSGKIIIDAISQQYSLHSTPYNGNEFSVEEKQYPLTFYPNKNSDIREWNFYYNPQDTLPDTAEVKFMWHVKDNQEYNIDTVRVMIYGRGVQQWFDIEKTDNCYITPYILNSNDDLYKDTIYIDPVAVGKTQQISVSMRNRGNINYQAKNQYLIDEFYNPDPPYFKLVRNFTNQDIDAQGKLIKGQYLNKNDLDSFIIDFTPDRMGDFYAEYIIENTFKERSILTSNQNDYQKTFVIKGVGINPRLELEIDTVNFGNVSYANHTDCPTQKDTVIRVYNTGNTTLIISDITTNNPQFLVSNNNLTIPANSFATLKITFIPKSPSATFTGLLQFKTNEIGIETSPVNLTLTGTSIQPIQARLQIPTVYLKPGTLLEIPINIIPITLLEQNAISYCSNYSFELNYNPKLLQYSNRITDGTASEGIMPAVEETTPGVLNISADKLYNNFIDNPVLIKLTFNTYLGDLPATEIAFKYAIIGVDINCRDYIQLSLDNGRYVIDSICGLDYKLNNTYNPFLFILNNTAIPNIYDLSYTISFDTEYKIDFFNYLGEVLFTESKFLTKGEYYRTIDISDAIYNISNRGIYYIQFTAGRYRKTIPIIYY